MPIILRVAVTLAIRGPFLGLPHRDHLRSRSHQLRQIHRGVPLRATL